MPLNFELHKNCLSERTPFVRITPNKRSCYMKKPIIAFLVALSVILAGCSALFSVGHSNTNTINQTDHKK